MHSVARRSVAMSGSQNTLPPDLRAKFMSFLREVNGQFELVDKEGLILFVAEHGKQYPELLGLFQLNEDALVEHYEKTGEVPPGVKLIRKTTQEGSNVVGLEVLRGPIPPRS